MAPLIFALGLTFAGQYIVLRALFHESPRAQAFALWAGLACVGCAVLLFHQS